MAKKTKAAVTNKKSDGASALSDIFKTLFGDIPTDPQSIFSEDNPFIRKRSDRPQTSQQLGLGFGSTVAIEKPSNGSSEKNDSVEVKKRKMNKEKKHSFDSDSNEEASAPSPFETKKSKKEKVKTPNLGLNGVLNEDDAEASNLDSKTKVKSKKDKGKTPILGAKSEGASNKDEDGQGENAQLGIELNSTVNMEIESGGGADMLKEKKKKKRKRDELEDMYEATQYGVVAKADGEDRGAGGTVVGEKRKTLDNPADMLVSKEGFDDERKLLRTVFVGNLPLKVKKKALLKEFSQFGEIESVRIRSVPLLDTKTPRKGAIIKKQINDKVDSVHAYVVFNTEQSAQASLAHNMAVVGGNHIRVDRACPPCKKLKGESALLYDHKRTVFVGNLPFDVKDEEIYQLFCNMDKLESSIEAVRVIRDSNTSLGKGIAYVLFKTREATNMVVKKQNVRLRDRELRLSHAKPESTSSKRKSLSTSENSPAKKLAVDSKPSYQGLRASKSGVEKKVRHPRSSEPAKTKSKFQKDGLKGKVRGTKRPAVAARKAKATIKGGLGSGGGGSGSKLTGKKRKPESWTPDSSRGNKRAKKFK